VAVLGNRATGLLDMAIEAFRDKEMGQQLAPTAPGLNTVMRQPTTVQVNPPQVATIETNPALNQMASMPLGQGVRATPQMMQQRTPKMPLGEGVRRPGADVMGMEKLAEDANKVVTAIQKNPELEQNPTFMDKVNEYFGNRENMVRLAMAFNTMRLTPDQGLAASLGAELKDLRAQKLAKTRGNATLEALRKAGVPEKDLQVLTNDPELLKKYAIEFFKKQLGTVPAEQQAFENLIAGMSEEDQEKARRIKAGLDPRAGSQFALSLEELFARSAAQAGGQVKGKTEEERTQEQVLKDRTWNMWGNALKTLEESLLGTSTGFVSGLLPAVTTSQQLADQSIAMMAPTLKNIFRESGEGVFTDQDQALLLAMIPNRGSNPEVIAQALRNIDNIVRIKLNQPEPIPMPNGGSQVLRFDAQGNPIQ
jgi:hypothetical protein